MSQKLLLIIVDEKVESPLDSKEIKSVNPKGNQPRISTGRTDAKAEAPILWSPDVNKRLWKRVFPRTLWKRPFPRTVGKDPDAEKD